MRTPDNDLLDVTDHCAIVDANNCQFTSLVGASMHDSQFALNYEGCRCNDLVSILNDNTIVPTLALCGKPLVTLVEILLTVIANPGEVVQALQEPFVVVATPQRPETMEDPFDVVCCLRQQFWVKQGLVCCRGHRAPLKLML
jgi:hypothetical protein